MKAQAVVPKPDQKKKEKKTLAQMSDEELQTMIHEMEYNRIKLPKSPDPRMVDLRERYTKRIVFLYNMLDSRKNRVKKDEPKKN